MKRKSYCVQCGEPDVKVGRISRRGLCASCGRENLEANARQLADKSGPAYRYYASRQRVGMERYLAKLDAMQAQHLSSDR